MLPFALLFAVQAIEKDVVVTGRARSTAGDCARGGCSPAQDAQDALDRAEAQFRAGDYRRARQVLAAAIARTRRFAAAAPRPVASLFGAYATVTLHDGDLDAFKSASGDRFRTLRDNLPPTDLAVADAMLSMGDMWLALGNTHSAEASYRAAEGEATARGQPFQALAAGLRRAWLAGLTGNVPRARRILAAIEAGPGAATPAVAAALLAVRLRIAAARGDRAEVDRLIAGIAGIATARPALVWEPPYRLDAMAPDPAVGGSTGDPEWTLVDVPGVEVRSWVDIGFWITPDGHTRDGDVLRGSASRGWARPLLDQVAGRRYTASADGAAAAGTYRVERFSLRGSWIVPTASHVRQRLGPVSLEHIDLTDPAAIAR